MQCSVKSLVELGGPPMTSSTTSLPGDVAAVWEVHQSDGIHTIKFEHGTTSGKRVIIVDGKEVRKLGDAR